MSFHCVTFKARVYLSCADALAFSFLKWLLALHLFNLESHVLVRTDLACHRERLSAKTRDLCYKTERVDNIKLDRFHLNKRSSLLQDITVHDFMILAPVIALNLADAYL